MQRIALLIALCLVAHSAAAHTFICADTALQKAMIFAFLNHEE